MPFSAYAGRITNLGVHNHSSSVVPWRLRRLLGKGTKFVPFVPPSPPQAILRDVSDYLRRLEWRLFFQCREGHSTTSQPPSKFIIPSRNWLNRDKVPDEVKRRCLEMHKTANEAIQRRLALRTFHCKDNLPRQERHTLKEFLADGSRVVLPADKNLGLVIVDRVTFNSACLQHLDATHDFQEVLDAQPPDQLFQTTLQMMQMRASYQSFPTFVKKYLEGYVASKDMARFYMIPKVHKPTLAWRPIIPATGTWNACLAKVVDHYLQPLVRNTPSFLQDSTNLIRILESEVRPDRLLLHEDFFFVTADVESLYTNIPLQEAWATTREAILNTTHPFKSCLSTMCQHVLFNNVFKFQDKVYVQVDGVATGSPLAPAVANLFMHSLESPVLQRWSKAVVLYRRYIDDIFLLFHGCRKDLDDFMKEMDTMHQNIKLTWTVSPHQVEFLDLVIYKGPRWPTHVDYRIHQKAFNSYLYLPWISHHPVDAKVSFITAELLRYAKNCSQRSDYLEVKRSFAIRLKQRGYPVRVINRAFKSVFYADRFKVLFPDTRVDTDPQSTPLVFKSRYDSMSRTIHWGTILNPKPLLQESVRVITAFRRSRNLFDIFRKNLMDFVPPG